MKNYKKLFTDIFDRIDSAVDYSSEEKERIIGGYTAEGIAECVTSALTMDKNFNCVVRWCCQVMDLIEAEDVISRIDEINGTLMHTPMPCHLALVLKRWLSMMQMCVPRRESVEYAASKYRAGIQRGYRAVALELFELNPDLEWDGELLVTPIVTALLDKSQVFVPMPLDKIFDILCIHVSASQKEKFNYAENECINKDSVFEIIHKLSALNGECLVSGIMMSEFTALFSAIAVYDYQRKLQFSEK